MDDKGPESSNIKVAVSKVIKELKERKTGKLTVTLSSPMRTMVMLGNTETINCAVNCGSGADLIDEHFLSSCRINHLNAGKYKGPQIEAVSGEALHITKVMRVAMEIGRRRLHATFLVARNLPFDVLLGNPFLNEHGTIINMHN